MPKPIIRATLAPLVALCALGCNGSGGAHQPMKPVTATVIYRGTLVVDATVTFISEGSAPASAFGKTDAQGRVRPKTPNLGDGVVLGKQKVLVSKEQIIGAKPMASQESADYAPPPPNAPPPQVKDLVPAKYKAPATTTLTAEVTASGPNDFKFELTDG